MKYPIAKDEAGKWVKITEALKGGKYFCPECQSPFIPKLGTIRAHHFAHHPDYPRACSGESGYHNLGKHLLAHYFETGRDFIVYAECPICRRRYRAVGKVVTVVIEKGESDYRPDVQLVLESGKKVNCEVVYKNPLSEEKIKTYRELGAPLLVWKIDDTVWAFTGFEQVQWKSFDLFYLKYESVLFLNPPLVPSHSCLEAETIELVMHGEAIHTKYCPIHKRDYRGHSYANVIDDCADCRFRVIELETDEWSKDGRVWPGSICCSGGKKKVLRAKAAQDVSV